MTLMNNIHSFMKDKLLNPLGSYFSKESIDATTNKMGQMLRSPAVKGTAIIASSTAVSGGLGALLGAASGATGAAIFKGVGTEQVAAAAQIGAAGSGLLSGAIALTTGAIIAKTSGLSFFNEERKADSKAKEGSCQLDMMGMMAIILVGDLIGYGLLLDTASSTMTLNESISYAAVGAGIIIPSFCCTVGMLLCLGMIGCALAMKNDEVEHPDNVQTTATPSPCAV